MPRRGRAPGAQASGPVARRLAESAALVLACGDAQALLAPQALSALAVQAPALLDQTGVGAAIAPAGLLGRDLTQAGSQRPIVGDLVGLVALGGAMLAGDPTRPALGELQAVCNMQTALRLRAGLTSFRA